MNLTEALKALKEGKRIRREGWSSRISYQFKDGVLLARGKQVFYIILSVLDFKADDWEVAEETYITEDEKEYLENLLRLYRDDYDFNFEKVMRNENLYLRITLIPYNKDATSEFMLLPLFGLNKPMFEGLEKNWLYITDDLKLFKE